MSSASVHPTWNADRVAEHLASLRTSADKAATIAEAFERAARQHRVDEAHYRSQIAHSEAKFAAPNPLVTEETP